MVVIRLNRGKKRLRCSSNVGPGLVLDLVEHQREIAAVREQPAFRKVRSLRTPEITVTTERPLPK